MRRVDYVAREKLLPHPFSLKFWTHDFTGIPDFRIPDSCHYLVGKDGYDEDCLRSYKSPEGFCSFTEGYVEDPCRVPTF